jgi:hypothetical protein
MVDQERRTLANRRLSAMITYNPKNFASVDFNLENDEAEDRLDAV